MKYLSKLFFIFAISGLVSCAPSNKIDDEAALGSELKCPSMVRLFQAFWTEKNQAAFISQVSKNLEAAVLATSIKTFPLDQANRTCIAQKEKRGEEVESANPLPDFVFIHLIPSILSDIFVATQAITVTMADRFIAAGDDINQIIEAYRSEKQAGNIANLGKSREALGLKRCTTRIGKGKDGSGDGYVQINSQVLPHKVSIRLTDGCAPGGFSIQRSEALGPLNISDVEILKEIEVSLNLDLDLDVRVYAERAFDETGRPIAKFSSKVTILFQEGKDIIDFTNPDNLGECKSSSTVLQEILQQTNTVDELENEGSLTPKIIEKLRALKRTEIRICEVLALQMFQANDGLRDRLQPRIQEVGNQLIGGLECSFGGAGGKVTCNKGFDIE